MLELKHTDRDDPSFLALVELLDRELWARYPETQAGYSAFNQIACGAYVVVATEAGAPAGCACLRDLGEGRLELKRMYVRPERRRSGLASAILRDLEAWARSCGAREIVLETGVKQPEAIRMYEKSGYLRIPSYGEYAGLAGSVCMAKRLASEASSRAPLPVIVAIKGADLAELKPLWEELNEHHLRNSEHFKDWFRDYSFEKHVDMRLKGKELFAQAIEAEGSYVAFCLSTVDAISHGEIDSLYVREAFRGSGYGRALVESALAWLGERKAAELSIATAGGNEEVFGFYAKFGFFPSGHVLRPGDPRQPSARR
jgi:putative acetyltransferase